MSYRAQASLCFVGLSMACQEPIFVPLESLGGAQMILAVVVRDGEVIVDRSQLIFPELGRRTGSEPSLDEGEILALAVFDEAALARGLLGPVELDPARISLHAASGADCGRRGNEVGLDSDGLSRMRQTLDRFGPMKHVVERATEGLRAPENGELDSMGRLEIEFPSNAEACLDRWRPRLEPLGRDASLGDGLFEGGTRLADDYLLGWVGIEAIGDGRLFLLTNHLAVALRRGARLDPAQDDFLRLNALGLPTPEEQAWAFHHMVIAEGVGPGTARLFALAVRVTREELTGSALIELPFDGASFGEPIVRVLFEEPGPTQMARDALGALVLAGHGGHWAMLPTVDSEVLTGTLGRTTIEALAVTPVPAAPHVLALGSGFVGQGDLREPEAFDIRRIRSESAVNVLTSTVQSGEPWLYSGWKDGSVFRNRMDSEAEPESVRFGLPRRLLECAAPNYDECGRGRPYERPLGLAFVEGPGHERLLVVALEKCPSVIVHELASGCTTSVDFPQFGPDDGRALELHQHASQLWVTDILANAEAYELRIVPAP